MAQERTVYRGRLAPSPTGLLHLGHGRTFWIAQERARAVGGQLLLRSDDLDSSRVRPEFIAAMFEDLHWLGIEWAEGPDRGGPHAPYAQSQRLTIYRGIFEQLRARGFLYPCSCSRQDVLRAIQAPHAADEEPLYPGTCREKTEASIPPGTRFVWRFRTSDGDEVAFTDLACGPQIFRAGRDFGDFVVWRHDGLPSYQLACVADDHFMGITEVVRGADLLLSTARQLLLYRALNFTPPSFYHTPLMTDEKGIRLAKRHDSLSLRQLRMTRVSPADLVKQWSF